LGKGELMSGYGRVLILVCGLVLAACGGKDDGGKSDKRQSGEVMTGDSAPLEVVQYQPIDCSKSWSYCYNIGETWPQSYPSMTKDMAYQLSLRWNMCASQVTGTLPWLWECAMGTCLSFEVPELDVPSIECILDASDCNEVRCCWGISASFGCDGEVSYEGGCDGTVSNNLASTINYAEWTGIVSPQIWDCAWSHNNPTCFATLQSDDPHELESGICGAGVCQDGTPASCDGDVLALCKEGILRRVDCAERGRICAPYVSEDEDQEAACVLATNCLLPHCDGNTAVFCSGGDEVMRIDCSWYGPGFSCEEGDIKDGQWFGGCRNPAAVCEYEVDEDYCEGSVAHYCTEKNQWFAFDCADFANGTCLSVRDSFQEPPRAGKPEPPPKYTVQCIEGL
jgi:hypothetical protein